MSTPTDQETVRAAIHPAVGIARVGNSQMSGKGGFFVGPEIPDWMPPVEVGFKESSGAKAASRAIPHLRLQLQMPP
jgi:hypothetical protein